MNQVWDIAIVGAGAAGMAAAVAAGRQSGILECNQSSGCSIALFDEDERVGRSILATGNGRCNFTNRRLDVNLYHNGAYVSQVLESLEHAAAAWDMMHRTYAASVPAKNDLAGSGDDAGGGQFANAVLEFFEDLGLEWRQEADGRLYPLANKASVVLDVLRAETARLGVVECCSQRVSAVEAPRGKGEPFTLRMADGVFNRARSVVVACGGAAVGGLEVAGLAKVSARPVLGPLRCTQAHRAITRELDNIRVRCTVCLLRESENSWRRIGLESGELLFRTYGVSGICVYNLSREALPGDRLAIDFLQKGGTKETLQYLQTRHRNLSRHRSSFSYDDMLRGLLLPRVTDAVLKSRGLEGRQACREQDLSDLALLLSHFELEVEGVGDARQCQVYRGGLDPQDFNPTDMQSRVVPGLFAAGEALDIDGSCGGYNLHWAWASGLLAGSSAMARLA